MRINILTEAGDVINGERQNMYGEPEDSFKVIADFWEVYMYHRPGAAVTPLDVAHMMTLFKIARMLGQKPNRDNYRDAIGYLAIAADRLSGSEALPSPANNGVAHEPNQDVLDAILGTRMDGAGNIR